MEEWELGESRGGKSCCEFREATTAMRDHQNVCGNRNEEKVRLSGGNNFLKKEKFCNGSIWG